MLLINEKSIHFDVQVSAPMQPHAQDTEALFDKSGFKMMIECLKMLSTNSDSTLNAAHISMLTVHFVVREKIDN